MNLLTSSNLQDTSIPFLQPYSQCWNPICTCSNIQNSTRPYLRNGSKNRKESRASMSLESFWLNVWDLISSKENFWLISVKNLRTLQVSIKPSCSRWFKPMTLPWKEFRLPETTYTCSFSTMLPKPLHYLKRTPKRSKVWLTRWDHVKFGNALPTSVWDQGNQLLWFWTTFSRAWTNSHSTLRSSAQCFWERCWKETTSKNIWIRLITLRAFSRVLWNFSPKETKFTNFPWRIISDWSGQRMTTEWETMITFMLFWITMIMTQPFGKESYIFWLVKLELNWIRMSFIDWLNLICSATSLQASLNVSLCSCFMKNSLKSQEKSC